MIPRQIDTRLTQRLSQFPAVALLGPRQVGKTTLARACQAAKSALYLDLEIRRIWKSFLTPVVIWARKAAGSRSSTRCSAPPVCSRRCVV